MNRHHLPPPVQLEWLIAGTRVLLAIAALLDVWLDSVGLPSVSPLVFPALFYYLAYSLAVLGLTWKPVRFTPSWSVAVHAFDVVAFSLFAAFAEGPASPVLFYFVFIVMCGTLRWRSAGALWTAVAAIAALGAAYAFAAFRLHIETFALDQFVRRSVQFAGTAALVGYLGAYSHPLARRDRPRRPLAATTPAEQRRARVRHHLAIRRSARGPVRRADVDRAEQQPGQHRVAIGRGSAVDSRAGGHLRRAGWRRNSRTTASRPSMRPRHTAASFTGPADDFGTGDSSP